MAVAGSMDSMEQYSHYEVGKVSHGPAIYQYMWRESCFVLYRSYFVESLVKGHASLGIKQVKQKSKSQKKYLSPSSLSAPLDLVANLSLNELFPRASETRPLRTFRSKTDLS